MVLLVWRNDILSLKVHIVLFIGRGGRQFFLVTHPGALILLVQMLINEFLRRWYCQLRGRFESCGGTDGRGRRRSGEKRRRKDFLKVLPFYPVLKILEE